MDKIGKQRVVVAILALAVFLSVLSPGASFTYGALGASNAILKLSPPSGTYNINGTFNVAIEVDTGGEAINAVKAYLTCPANKLEVTNIDTTGSFLTFLAENTYDNTNGTIHLQGALSTPGYTGTDGLVVTVTFKVKSAGTADVTFDSDCRVLRNSDSSDILSNKINGSYALGDISLVTPSPPQSLSATPNNSQITLTWQPSTQGTYPIAGYAIYRGTEKGKEDFTNPFAQVDANTTSYTDKDVETGKAYYYVVKAYDNQNPPDYSTSSDEVKGVLKDITPPDIIVISPKDNTVVQTDFVTISGKITDEGSGVKKATVNGSAVSLSPDGSFSTQVDLTEGTNTIILSAVDNAGNEVTKNLTVTYHKEEVSEVVINLQIGNPLMIVNGATKEIDPGRGTKPVIIKGWNRTVVPIRAIVEALNGTIEWEPTDRKVTINFNKTVIKLWIDNPEARVDGEMRWIDANNHNVKPIIVNDRTMLPLRFVVESLGCKVNWYPETKAITITYGG